MILYYYIELNGMVIDNYQRFSYAIKKAKKYRKENKDNSVCLGCVDKYRTAKSLWENGEYTDEYWFMLKNGGKI